MMSRCFQHYPLFLIYLLNHILDNEQVIGNRMASIASFGQRIVPQQNRTTVHKPSAVVDTTSSIAPKNGQQQSTNSNTPPALENCEDNGGVDVDYVNNFDDDTPTIKTKKAEETRGDDMHNAESQVSSQVLSQSNSVGPDGKKTLELGLDKFKTGKFFYHF